MKTNSLGFAGKVIVKAENRTATLETYTDVIDHDALL